MKPLHTIAALLLLAGLCLVVGCKHHEITAVPLSRWNCDEPEGIPFYLPKPLLIISKNFRNIEETKVGLTSSAPIPNYFDDQARYADLNSRSTFQRMTSDSGTPPSVGNTTSTTTITAPAGSATASAPVLHSGGVPVTPSTVASDGIAPETFYTYQIVFVPDLSQKYGLKIKGGVGEIRAAMNLVNGWQFTGLGPYYMKDSSSAQNILAGGIGANLTLAGVADVLNELQSRRDAAAGGGGKGVPPGGPKTIDTTTVTKMLQPLQGLNRMTFHNFAEIYVYEQVLTDDGHTAWQPVANHSFYRDMLGFHKTCETSQSKDLPPQPANPTDKGIKPPTPKPGVEPKKRELSRAAGDVGPGVGHVTLQNINYPAPQPAQPKPAPAAPAVAKRRGHSFFDLFHKRRPQIRTIRVNESRIARPKAGPPARTQDLNAPQFGVTPQINEPE